MNPQSPHDNIPELEGDIYAVTVRLDEPIEHDGGMKETITLSTIQPSKEEAYKRLVYIVKTQWDRTIDEVVETEKLEGTRDEQLEELMEYFKESGVATPDMIKQEFVDHLTTYPAIIAAQMFENLPEMLQDEIYSELPLPIKQYL